MADEAQYGDDFEPEVEDVEDGVQEGEEEAEVEENGEDTEESEDVEGTESADGAPGEETPDESDQGDSEQDVDGDGSEGEDAKLKTPAFDDETEVQIGDTKVTLGELKESHQLVEKAIEVRQQAMQKIELADQFVGRLAQKPMDTLLDMFTKIAGDHDTAYKFLLAECEGVIMKHIEWEALPDDKREALKYQKEATELRSRLEAREKAETTEKQSKAEMQEMQNITAEFEAALDGVKLKKTPQAIRDMAKIAVEAADAGINVTADQIAVKYKRALEKKRDEFLKELDPDDLTPELRDKLRKARIDKVKSTKIPKKGAKRTRRSKEDDNPVIPMADYQDWLNGKL